MSQLKFSVFVALLLTMSTFARSPASSIAYEHLLRISKDMELNPESINISMRPLERKRNKALLRVLQPLNDADPTSQEPPSYQEPSPQDSQSHDSPSTDSPSQDSPPRDSPSQDPPSQNTPSQDPPSQDPPSQDSTPQDPIQDEVPNKDQGSHLLYDLLVLTITLAVYVPVIFGIYGIKGNVNTSFKAVLNGEKVFIDIAYNNSFPGSLENELAIGRTNQPLSQREEAI